MIYDELLAKIQSDYEDNKHFRDERNWKSFAALSAVVELHTPRKAYFGDDEIVCRACGSADIEWTYPCPTIQAIEKELS